MSQQAQHKTQNKKQRKRKSVRDRAKAELDAPTDQAERLRNIKQQYIRNIALNCDRNQPIMDDDSDEEMKYEINADQDENGTPYKKLKTKENDNVEDMFLRDDKFFSNVLNIDKTELTDEEYVKL